MFSLLDCIVCFYETVLVLDVSKVITLRHMTQNAVHYVFLRRIKDFFCNSLFFTFVNFVALFIDRLVWQVYESLLCELRQWCQCSLVD